ncbi:hypothetical protein EDB19DRAFT_393499 [Suillus lakei]|nr:hypothetical protein EDB19DRAFT_393499 [Suillus lakei]
MLGANLFYFQTYSYARHFTSTCVRVCGCETTSRGAMAAFASASGGASAVPRGAGSGAGSTSGSKATLSANGTGSTRGTGLTRGRKSGVEKYVGIDVQRHVAAVTHCPVGLDAERVARDTFSHPGDSVQSTQRRVRMFEEFCLTHQTPILSGYQLVCLLNPLIFILLSSA